MGCSVVVMISKIIKIFAVPYSDFPAFFEILRRAEVAEDQVRRCNVVSGHSIQTMPGQLSYACWRVDDPIFSICDDSREKVGWMRYSPVWVFFSLVVGHITFGVHEFHGTNKSAWTFIHQFVIAVVFGTHGGLTNVKPVIYNNRQFTVRPGLDSELFMRAERIKLNTTQVWELL